MKAARSTKRPNGRRRYCGEPSAQRARPAHEGKHR